MNITEKTRVHSASATEDTFRAGPRSLSRPTDRSMLAGVAAGMADYLGLDPTVVRIVLAVLAVAGGVGVPIYLLGWLLIPATGAEESIAGHFLRAHPLRSL